MSVVYFDSSALVKLLVDEEGSELAVQLWDAGDVVVSSRLAYPEVRAALAAAGRSGRLSVGARRAAEAAWEDFWSEIRPVEMAESIATHAGELAATHALRGADAVHLASCLAFDTQAVIAVWDARLAAGAQATGLRTVPMYP